MEERRHLSELGSSVVGVAGDTKALFGSDSRWSRNPDELEKHRGQTVRDLRASDRSNRDAIGGERFQRRRRLRCQIRRHEEPHRGLHRQYGFCASRSG